MAIFGNMIGGGGGGDTADVSAGFYYGKDARYIYSSKFKGNTDINEVSYPNVTTLYKDAFAGCTNLFSVNFPKLTSLNNQAFSGCTNLRRVNGQNLIYIGDGALYNCSTLTSLPINNLISLGDSAFFGCVSLPEEMVFDNLTSISGSLIFENLSSVNRVLRFPKITSLGSEAFFMFGLYSASLITTYGSSSMSSGMHSSNRTRASVYFDNLVELTTGVIDTSTGIRTRSPFAVMRAATPAAAPGVSNFAAGSYGRTGSYGSPIIDYYFSKLSYIPSIAFAGNNLSLNMSTPISMVGSYAFTQAYIRAFNVSFTENATISRFAFTGAYFATNISSDTFASVYFETSAAANTYGIFESASFPDGTILKVKSIPNYTFRSLRGNSLAIYAYDAETVGAYAFMSCTGLTSVYFSKVSVINIGAFSKCTNLKTIDMRYVSSVPIFGNGVDSQYYGSYFSSVTSENLSVIVPKSLYSAFSQASVWNTIRYRIFSVSV